MTTQSVKGVKHIYEIKGRDFSKPVAICVSAVDDIEKYVGSITVCLLAITQEQN